MSTIKNPVFNGALIDLGATIEEYNPTYGRIAESGLFEEQGINTTTHMYQIEKQPNTRMTKLTSRTGRESMSVIKGKRKAVNLSSVTVKEDGGVHVEDLQNVLQSWDLEQEEGFAEAVAKEARRLADVGAANLEYIAFTATQGIVRDPYNGDDAIDQFTNTGTVRSTATIDANPATQNLLSDLNALRNQVSTLNGFNGNFGEIEVVVSDADFTAITSHPDLISRFQLALQGTGGLYLGNEILNGNIGIKQKSRYGWAQEFRFENIVFRTYPQKFYRWDGAVVEPTVQGKAWTIVHGATGLYEAKFCPAPYVSQLRQKGQKWFARSTGIKNDTHLDITIESHNMYFMTRPEMSIDITITTA